MAYFAMLSGQGWTAIAGCRQFFYARYVDWAIITPLIILELGLIAGAEPSAIASAIGADGEDTNMPPPPITSPYFRHFPRVCLREVAGVPKPFEAAFYLPFFSQLTFRQTKVRS